MKTVSVSTAVLLVALASGQALARTHGEHRKSAIAPAAAGWIERQKLVANEGTGGDNFGYSVALSGSTALIGALQTTVAGHQYQGTAYVFTNAGAGWTEQQALVASDGNTNDNFGKAVALEGQTAFVSAQGASVGGHRAQGAVYVFTESNGLWTQQQKLVAADGAASDNFGGALVVSGTTLVVGAYNAAVDGSLQQGAAYVFTESNGTWTQQQKLVASDGMADDQFGHSLALDDTTLLIGAWGATIDGNDLQGAAYVFGVDAADGGWSESQKLTASDGASSDVFSGGLAVSGTQAVIGAPYAQIGNNFGQGAAYTFNASGGTWNESGKLVADDGGESDSFGYFVALDGNTALVGATNATVGTNTSQGAAYVFSDADGGWAQLQKLVAADGTAYNRFGCAGALSASDAMIGAEFAPINGAFGQGAAYVFENDDIFADGFDGSP